MTVKIITEEGASSEAIKKAREYKKEIEEKYSSHSEKFWDFWENVIKDFPDSNVSTRGESEAVINVPTNVNLCSEKAIKLALRSLEE